MKQIKFIAAIILCLFLLTSISRQATANLSLSYQDNMAPAYIQKSVPCTLPDGTSGRIADCFIAQYGSCRISRNRKCNGSS